MKLIVCAGLVAALLGAASADAAPAALSTTRTTPLAAGPVGLAGGLSAGRTDVRRNLAGSPRRAMSATQARTYIGRNVGQALVAPAEPSPVPPSR